MQETVAQFADRLPIPLELRIRAEYVSDPCDFDPYSSKHEQGEQPNRDEYHFEFDTVSSRFALKNSQTPTDILNELSQLKSFANLAPILQTLTSNEWAWIDFNIGVTFQVQNEGSPSEATHGWSASDLWTNFLSHLSPWLV